MIPHGQGGSYVACRRWPTSIGRGRQQCKNFFASGGMSALGERGAAGRMQAKRLTVKDLLQAVRVPRGSLYSARRMEPGGSDRPVGRFGMPPVAKHRPILLYCLA